MRSIFALAAMAAALAPARCEGPPRDAAPYYSSASIANAATHTAGPFAPNVIVSIYGTDLARTTAGISEQDVQKQSLPNELAGVRVYVDNFQAGLYFVSPNQVNFLLPASLAPGERHIRVVRESVYGPSVALTLTDTAPVLFLLPDSSAILAAHLDGSLISSGAPAHPGEWIVLYAAGLGPITPRLLDDLALPSMPAALAHMADFSILLTGHPLERGRIYYAGISPPYPGLYQVNVQIPDDGPENPEIRLGVGGRLSPEGQILPVTRQPAAAGAR